MRLLSRVKSAVVRLRYFIQLYGQHLPMGFEMVFSMRCSVILLRGTMKGGGPLALLYIGRRKNYHFIVNEIFDVYEVVEEKRSSLMTFRRQHKRMEPLSDVMIMDIGWPYHGLLNRNGEYLELPDWVNMSLTLGDTWEETVRLFRSTIRRQDVRHIRLNGYRCEPTSERQAIETFYDTMYLPFIKSRHSEDAVKASRRHVVRRGCKGSLLQILKDDRVVAGGVVYPENGALFFLWMGMPAADLEDPPQAVISAMYYFGIRYAYDNDLWAVDFTGTRTFLNSGAYRFKRKWGALVEDTFSPSSILVRPGRGNLAAARFCQRFPMLVRRDGGLEWLFLSMDETVDEEGLSGLEKQYGCNGLNRINVVDISGLADSGCQDLNMDRHAIRVIHAQLENFADHFARHAAEKA